MVGQVAGCPLDLDTRKTEAVHQRPRNVAGPDSLAGVDLAVCRKRPLYPGLGPDAEDQQDHAQQGEPEPRIKTPKG